jgi:hypothetical protein
VLENTRGLDKWKGLKPSEPVIRLTQSAFELLLELSVFLFQFNDVTLFGEDYEVFARIRLACWTSQLFTYPLFLFLQIERLDTISELRLVVQIRFTDTRRLRYRVEVDCLVFSQKMGDSFIL